MKTIRSLLRLASVTAMLMAVLTTSMIAHCDTKSGPVVKAARRALELNDLRPALAWIHPGSEDEVRTAFRRTLVVRALSPEARDLADAYFFETLVRVHREGEGAPYTGLKDDGPGAEPGIALAERALQAGSVDELTSILTASLRGRLNDAYQLVVETQKNAQADVQHGRGHVRAYVAYIHAVEAIHRAIDVSETSQTHDALEHQH